MPRYIIEHLEPEVYDWCMLEYAHIASFVGKENLLFTNVTGSELMKLGSVDVHSAKEMSFDNACILDPEAKEELTPETAKKFDNFIFGGILGDDPPKARTKEELPMPYPRYNLGKAQMSTDTAVIVTKMIADGTPLSKLKFQDGYTVEISEGEEVHLPYKYLLVEGKVLFAPGLIELLRNQEEF